MSVVKMLREGASIDQISSELNKLSHEQRKEEIYKFKGKDQEELYKLAEGRFCGSDFFVPENEFGKEVIHWGVNSLPAFSRFQKRMIGEKSPKKKYSGYNEQVMKALTGPGYFTLLEAKEGPEGKQQLAINYKEIPGFKYGAWPKLVSNKYLLSRFIYNDMQDWMWKVSDHVSIGRARRDNQWLDNWFILCRQEN